MASDNYGLLDDVLPGWERDPSDSLDWLGRTVQAPTPWTPALNDVPRSDDVYGPNKATFAAARPYDFKKDPNFSAEMQMRFPSFWKQYRDWVEGLDKENVDRYYPAGGAVNLTSHIVNPLKWPATIADIGNTLTSGPRLLQDMSTPSVPIYDEADPYHSVQQREWAGRVPEVALSIGVAAAPLGPREGAVSGMGGGSIMRPTSNGNGFYSNLERHVEQSPTKSAPPAQWKSTLQNAGLKKEELADNGVIGWLDQQPQDAKITREALLARTRVGTPQVEARTLYEGEHGGDFDEEMNDRIQQRAEEMAREQIERDHLMGAVPRIREGSEEWDELVDNNLEEADVQLRAQADVKDRARYGGDNMVTPGGENYQETLLKLNRSEEPWASWMGDRLRALEQRVQKGEPLLRSELDEYGQLAAAARRRDTAPDVFQSSHWPDDPNVIAHYRTSEFNVSDPAQRPAATIAVERDALQREIDEKIDKDPYFRNIGEHANYADAVTKAYPKEFMRYNALNEEYLKALKGVKTLHSHEFQSDWHQRGFEEGYRGPRPPDTEKMWHDQFVRDVYDKARNRYGIHIDPQRVIENPEQAIKDGLFSWDDFDRLKAYREQDHRARTGPPDAPFKRSWDQLAFMHFLQDAVDRGFDAVSWDTGRTNAGRWGQTRQADRIEYDPESKQLVAYRGGSRVYNQEVKPESVPHHVGKNVAKQLLEQPRTPYDEGGFKYAEGSPRHVLIDRNKLTPEEWAEYDQLYSIYNVQNRGGGTGAPFRGSVHELGMQELNDRGLGERFLELRDRRNAEPPFRVGGAGMRRHYDDALVQHANKIGKKYGTKVEDRTVNGDENLSEFPPTTVHFMKITPELRDAVRKGLTLYNDQRPLSALSFGPQLAKDAWKPEELEALQRRLRGIEEITGGISDKTGTKYLVTREPGTLDPETVHMQRELTGKAIPYNYMYRVWDKDHLDKPAAQFIYDSESHSVLLSDVNKNFRRKGIASAAYKHMEDDLGEPLYPNDVQTPMGQKFWNARRKRGQTMYEDERPLAPLGVGADQKDR